MTASDLRPASLAVTVAAASDRRSFEEASVLYTQTFGYSPETTLNSRLLRAIVHSGGIAVAARADDGLLVGFAYGFPGRECGREFLYSQAAFVAPAFQSMGIGRLLKLEQRRLALQAGYTTMRWSFDPALSRNAHVNFDVLGASSHRFAADYYDDGASDRLIVEWPLTPNPTRPQATFTGDASAAVWGTVQKDARHWALTLPRRGADVSEGLRRKLGAAFVDAFAAGMAARACLAIDQLTAAYILQVDEKDDQKAHHEDR